LIHNYQHLRYISGLLLQGTALKIKIIDSSEVLALIQQTTQIQIPEEYKKFWEELIAYFP
jgi:hypothetical protein